MAMPDQVTTDLHRVPYTYGYFKQVSPQHLRLCALSMGVGFDAERPLRYLELGMGQGVSLAVHAAACAGEFWGNDYNRAHAEHAKELASVLGSRVRALPDSFAELAARNDLPEFDIIALHGIWSWVSPENRVEIVDIARRKLAPGGLLYVSYNCSYGWSAAAPLRQLMRLYARHEAPPGMSATSKTEAAMEFVRELAGLGASYFRANPTVLLQFRNMMQRGKVYLAHEFFGEHWHLTSLPEVAGDLAAAGLRFAATTFLLEHGEEGFPPEMRLALAKVTEPMMKEAVKECFINPQFRSDIFVKTPSKALSEQERLASFRSQRFMLMSEPESISYLIPGPRGDIALDRDAYGAVVSALASRGFSPKSVDEIAALIPAPPPTGKLIEQLLALTSAGYVSAAQGEAAAAAARPNCARLNALILEQARVEGNIHALASPVLGAGFNLDRIGQFFLLARAEGGEAPGEWADYVLRLCDETGEPVFWQGAQAEGATRREAVLKRAEAFAKNTLPILKAAGVTEVGRAGVELRV